MSIAKPEIVRNWCSQHIGCPYIMGATGKPCTPTYRKARMKQYPVYANKIERNCPRLFGKTKTCTNCKWFDSEANIGKLAYDCAQLSRWAMDSVGIKLISGANSQWEQTNWQERGTINDNQSGIPKDKVCLVFRWDDDKNKMGHVGIYQGNGTVIHAKGHDYGVVQQNLSDVKFSHWGIPYGLYKEEPQVDKPTLRKGDNGEYVSEMQQQLISLNYLPQGSDDGIFGTQTLKALKKFQCEHNLKDDGVCGKKTWIALLQTNIKQDDANDDLDADIINDNISISKEDWNELEQLYYKFGNFIDKYSNIVG